MYFQIAAVTLFYIGTVVLIYFGRGIFPKPVTGMWVMISWFSLLVLFERLDSLLLHRNIVATWKHHWKALVKIGVVGLLFGLLMELFGAFLTRLWYYPHGNLSLYLILTPIAQPLYFFFLFEVYDFLHRKFFHTSTRPVRFHSDSPFYIHLMQSVGLVGFVATCVAMAVSVHHAIQSGISPLAINQTFSMQVPAWLPFLASLSVFLLAEYANYTERKHTLVFDMINGRLGSLLAIVVSALIGILFVEFANSPLDLWVFDNWAYNDARIGTIPILAYLVWPTQFLVFLSFLRLVFKPRTIQIW